MKSFIGTAWLLVVLVLSGTAAAYDEQTLKNRLDTVDALEAMAIANELKGTLPSLKSYVNPREVVFKFPDGTVKNIPLPEEKMLVAIAPYMQVTHQ